MSNTSAKFKFLVYDGRGSPVIRGRFDGIDAKYPCDNGILRELVDRAVWAMANHPGTVLVSLEGGWNIVRAIP